MVVLNSEEKADDFRALMVQRKAHVDNALSLASAISKTGGSPYYLAEHFESLKEVFVFTIAGQKVEFSLVAKTLVSYFTSIFLVVALPLLSQYSEGQLSGSRV